MPFLNPSNGGTGITLGSSTTVGTNTTGFTLTGQSITGAGDNSLIALSTTWNTTGVVQGILLDCTFTAAGAGSRLFNLRVGGVSIFSVSQTGSVVAGAAATFFALTFSCYSTGSFNINADTILLRDASNVFAMRNSTTAQGFRVYNTYTSGTSLERADFSWASNLLRIGTVKGSGGGTARSLALITDDTPRLTIDLNGNITIANTGSAPAAPAAGFVLYAEAGAAKIRGSGGTITTIATA